MEGEELTALQLLQQSVSVLEQSVNTAVSSDTASDSADADQIQYWRNLYNQSQSDLITYQNQSNNAMNELRGKINSLIAKANSIT